MFSWETNDHQGVDYRIQVQVVTVSEEYSRWRAKAGGDLFGERPDSKVMVTAQTLAAALPLSILDVGAGDGRNTLALLRIGTHRRCRGAVGRTVGAAGRALHLGGPHLPALRGPRGAGRPGGFRKATTTYWFSPRWCPPTCARRRPCDAC